MAGTPKVLYSCSHDPLSVVGPPQRRAQPVGGVDGAARAHVEAVGEPAGGVGVGLQRGAVAPLEGPALALRRLARADGGAASAGQPPDVGVALVLNKRELL